MSHLILTKVDAAVLECELVSHPVNDSFVEVVTAKTVVTLGCKNLEYAVGNIEKRNVEGTATKVEYHDLLRLFLIHTVCKSCRGRLVDNSLYLKACNSSCILG